MTQEFNLTTNCGKLPKKEFVLSEKIIEVMINESSRDIGDAILKEDVKEFIKRLKEKFRKEFPLFYSIKEDNDFVHIRFGEIVDKLAGQKLSGELK